MKQKLKKKINKNVVSAMAFAIALTLAGTASAECRGGTEVKGVINDHTYCISNITMTWWSAFTWCQANNRTLAEWDEACPGVSVGSKCTNMDHDNNPDVDFPEKYKDKYAWTAQPHATNASGAYSVNLSSGAVTNASFRNGNLYALCK